MEEAIHHEIVFKASPQRVYDALTNAKQFDAVTRLSAAMKSGLPLAAKPTTIGRGAGAAFSLFGGHITGRHIELLAGQRIVQAWRAANWDAGAYSIVRFELTPEGNGTKLVFHHAGFPKGQSASLADGWRSNYWEPLEKFLATTSAPQAAPKKRAMPAKQ